MYCQYGADCVRQPDGGAKCECIRTCTQNYQPVCGSDSKTYSNGCEMNVKACNEKIELIVKHTGQCGKLNDETGKSSFTNVVLLGGRGGGGGG